MPLNLTAFRPFSSAALVIASAVVLSACGHNMEQRAATGAATGAVVGGPVGAVVGAGVGAVIDTASKPKE